MSNTFQGRGNLGDNPVLKFVQVGSEQRAVCELRIYCDRLIPDGDDGYVDKGGFWLDVAYWGDRGENAARLLRKGMRVRVEGTLVQESWQDRQTDEDRSKLVLQADFVDLDLGRIEAVVARRKAMEQNKPGISTGEPCDAHA